jgi:uncharacterized membrane protein
LKADPATILGTIMAGLLVIWFVGALAHVAAEIAGLVGSSHRQFSFTVGLLSPFSVSSRDPSSIVDVIVASFVMPGIVNFSLKVAKGVPYAFADLFSGIPLFFPALVAHVLTLIGVGIGLLLFIVPGVILAIGLSMALPLIVDRGMGPTDALRESWKITAGNRANLFLFALIAFGLFVGGVCFCLVGTLLVFPLVSIAHIYIYLKLTGQPVAMIAPRV